MKLTRNGSFISLEQTIERVQQQQVSIKAVEQIEDKPVPLTSKVVIEKTDYQELITTAQKYVVQEKQEGKLKKLLKEVRKTIDGPKSTIADLTAKLAAATKELDKYKSVQITLRTGTLENENRDLRSKLHRYEDVISRNNLWHFFGRGRTKAHTIDEAR